MQQLDLTCATPAEHLAADEALLDWCEAGHPGHGEMLLFWEPRDIFVVVGYANKVAAEVNVPVCEARGIPIFRRCSGGGTVVQMPGGLNYSLILRITETGPTRNISAANHYIMEKNRTAVQAALGPDGPAIVVRGHTDLAFAGPDASPATVRKVAGNSQRRRKRFLLFHGTLLLNCQLKLIGELLRMPTLQPDYRASRTHGDFVANLNVSAATVKTAFARAWNAEEAFAAPPLDEIQRLAREKYVTREWNFKF
jgi:lipoate-protein ligase A